MQTWSLLDKKHMSSTGTPKDDGDKKDHGRKKNDHQKRYKYICKPFHIGHSMCKLCIMFMQSQDKMLLAYMYEVIEPTDNP